MTLRERIEKIEQKTRMLNACGWKCEVCGKPLTLDGCQMAHRIPQYDRYIKQYGKKVIHHRFNLKCVCSESCNASVQMKPDTQPILADELVKLIQEDLCS